MLILLIFTPSVFSQACIRENTFTERTGEIESHQGYPTLRYDNGLSCEYLIDIDEEVTIVTGFFLL